MSVLPYGVAAALFLVGLWGVARTRHLVHLVNCLNVAQSSAYVLLLALGWRAHGTAPVFREVAPKTPVADPVLQALVVTGIVVGATVSALLLAIAVQAQKRHGSVDPDTLREMQG